MDRIIKLMQVAGAVVLFVAVVAGYSFVRGLSAQAPGDCESDPYCLEDSKWHQKGAEEICGEVGCNTRNSMCCLPEIIVTES